MDLYFDRINLNKGIDLTKNNNTNECIICHNSFFNHGFIFHDYICNGCHNLTMLSLS